MKTFRKIREHSNMSAMSVTAGSAIDGVTDHEGHDEDSISDYQENNAKDAKDKAEQHAGHLSDHQKMYNSKAVNETEQLDELGTKVLKKYINRAVWGKSSKDKVEKRVTGVERATRKILRKTGDIHDLYGALVAEGIGVLRQYKDTVLPPEKPAKDKEPLIDKIRRVVKKKRLGIKEDFRRAADHEHSMARRYLDQMDDGEHLAVKSVGVHDKKGHIHIHYAAKGQAGGGRYVVLNRNGKEMDLKKKKK